MDMLYLSIHLDLVWFLLFCSFHTAPLHVLLGLHLILLLFEKWMLSHFSHVRLFATLWIVVRQAPLSMGFSRQEYWSGLPFPSPGDLPNLGIEPRSPVLQADSLPSNICFTQRFPKFTWATNSSLLRLALLIYSFRLD